jgi:uncharacterized protein (DUF2267 family)
VAAGAAFVVAVAAVSALVRAWRRERDLRAPSPLAAPEDDLVVADRVRSELGGVESALDVPHVHVMVERGVVLLHGEVPTTAAAHVLEGRARAVRGVRGVVSHLHVGMLAGDTAPSEGTSTMSLGARRLVHAAVTSGGGEVTGELATRAVLAALARTVPMHVRRRLCSHLPIDVACWLETAGPTKAWQTVDELYADVVAASGAPAAHTPWIVGSVLRELRSLVPADDEAVAAALPPALSHLWRDAAPTG